MDIARVIQSTKHDHDIGDEEIQDFWWGGWDDSVVRSKKKECTCEKYLRRLFSKGVRRPEIESVRIVGVESVTNP